MTRTLLANVSHLESTEQRTRRGIVRWAAGAGASVAGLAATLDALGKKKKRKKKCKKPKPVTLLTELVSCPGPSASTATGSRRFAQTFAAPQTGALTTALVELEEAFTGTDFVIEIRAVDSDGVPTDEILASAEVNDVPDVDSESLGTLTALFDPPASVVKDDEYALVITEASANGYTLRARFSDPCAGKLFVDVDADGNFIPEATVDMVFTVSITFAT